VTKAMDQCGDIATHIEESGVSHGTVLAFGREDHLFDRDDPEVARMHDAGCANVSVAAKLWTTPRCSSRTGSRWSNAPSGQVVAVREADHRWPRPLNCNASCRRTPCSCAASRIPELRIGRNGRGSVAIRVNRPVSFNTCRARIRCDSL
jgi:hypothetical protein